MAGPALTGEQQRAADVIPESEHGAGGYIDDVFLCAYVIKKLALKLGDTGLLDASWYGAEGLLDVADHILEETSKSIPQETRWQILRYVGVEERREDVT